MLKKIASIISTILHPLLMPTIGILVIFSTESHITFIPFEFRRLVTIIVFVSTCILPLSAIPIFLQTGIIKSIHMETPRERILPLLTTGFFFILGYYFLKKFQLPAFIPLFFLGTLVAVIISMCISFFWKISIHMIGVGGLFGALISMTLKYGVDTNIWIMVTIAISGLLGSSRLGANAHSPAQVYSGFFLGCGTICSIVMI
ncbi:PAP2 family protein [Plebeiibacterium marinum]|uniref:PAP2 family protein n=1 Tax=Plebeiibacterium marinum TaxID=2992111 RepID=A0AAE3MC22_9BACT|nr:PAP2 family protein [Plebeiobacterium marinum]MCW3805158.1 PAP2 family protein [Plebeiobacterium marinum]